MAKKSLIIDSDMDLEHKVTALLMCLAQEKKADMTRAISHTGLSLLQLNLLHNLEYAPSHGLTVNQLKEQLPDESSNVSRALNKLVDTGLAVKTRDDIDQRVVYVTITRAGKKAHKEADKQLGKIQLGLPEKQLNELYHLLQKI